MAPLGTFRPGDTGFGVHAPSRLRPSALVGSAWTVLMVAGAIAMLGLFLRLTHHQPRPPFLRGTLRPVSWMPAPRSTERDFVRLEVTGERP